jgi:dienelactone hydrolase
MIRTLTLSALAVAFACAADAAPPPAAYAGVNTQDVSWYSEQVKVSGKLFKAAGAKAPAVVLAPGWGETAASMDAYALALAKSGVSALAMDYRGWGKSGGFLYLGQRVDTYDALRFTDQTPDMIVRRGRLDPELQVQDIRNAITFLQGMSDVDPGRIGVLGVGISGGHVISVLGMDARAKVGVAVTPVIAGANEKRQSYIPSAADQAALVKLAREGAAPRTDADGKKRNAEEAALALKEYKPFWRIDAIPNTDAVRFITAGKDGEIDNAANAVAASKALKATNDVQTLPNAKHRLTDAEQADAAKLAAEWAASKLK